MPSSESNLAEHSGGLLESHKGYDPRVIFFYFVVAALLLILAGGLAYQQLFKSDTYHERERVQSQRRVLVPGPRGNIYARDGVTVLVGNRPRFSVVIYLDELKSEFLREAKVIKQNYRKSGMTEAALRDMPFSRMGRISVVQRYLDEVNRILGRIEKVDAANLVRHLGDHLLLPYPLLEDLSGREYARLIESLPVRSPLQVYTSSTRHYPFGSAAAHALGYVRVNDDVIAEDFPGEDLATFKMKSTVGKDGLEKAFDDQLQGESGATIVRVDSTGFKVTSRNLPHRIPVQGKNLVSSLDIDLQLAAEKAIGDQVGAAVALDISTGEVLTMVSKPDYNLADFSPRVSFAAYAEIQAKGGEFNRALSGLYPPGSTFKILTTIAGLRRGVLDPTQSIVNCQGQLRVGNRMFVCDNGNGHHGEVLLPDAIARSCDIYFFTAGALITPEALAEEGRRFHLDRRTGIELPNETRRMVIPDLAYKEKIIGEKWFPGDTANTSIGQGYVLLTPLQMACFVASVARGEISTHPSFIHQPNRPPQHTEPIGLTPAQRSALVDGMVAATTYGTARKLNLGSLKIPGVSIAGKTGTAQKKVTIDGKTGNINIAWFICFAPAENPEIAMAVMIEGDTIGENFGGGDYSAPVASAILQKYFEKKNRPTPQAFQPFKPN